MSDLHPFLVALATALDIDPDELDDSYEFVWESMLVLIVITLLSQHLDLTLEVDELTRCKTVGELCRIIRGRRLAA